MKTIFYPVIRFSVVIFAILIFCDKNPSSNNNNDIKAISVSTDKLAYNINDTVVIDFYTGNSNDTIYIPHCNFVHYGLKIENLSNEDHNIIKICPAIYAAGRMPAKIDTIYQDHIKIFHEGTYRVKYQYEISPSYTGTLFVYSEEFEVK